MYTVAALTAAIALSASFAIFKAGAGHDVSASGHIASANTSHLAESAQSADVHASQRGMDAMALGNSGSSHGASPSAPKSVAAATPPSTPTLVTVQGGAHVLAGGAQKAVPVAVNEDQALQAIFKGGMWLPNATGGREYAKYDHHLIHDNGDWTWVGKVQTTYGPQSAVITFGKDAVFGRIPQASGNALRLVTSDGQRLLVQTDAAKMAASAQNRQLYARQDFQVPRHSAASSQARASSAPSHPVASASQPVASAATASGTATVDVMVAYTSGFATAQGGASAAATRINNLVDVTNQAYTDSGVNEQIRLVHTMQVSYTDTNDDTKALDDVTGNDGNGNSVPIPSALQTVASTRTQYGADLVVLLRQYNNAGNGGCGVGWLIGGDEQQIIPSEDNAFGYSVVQDGSDGGYYCLDTTFAHELGHNMGSAHDRANAEKDSNGNPIPGAYSYSFGYLGNGTNGFATIMAYGSATQTPVNYFSNPNISKCQNTPCGVADSSTSSADNAHSLSNTAPLIAQFEPNEVATSGAYVHNDVDGNGESDLFWYSQNLHQMTYWLMNGPTMTAWKGMALPAGYQPVGIGDFDGDKRADILWSDSSHHLYMWVNNGAGGFTSHLVTTYKSYSVAAVGDIDGDGKSDIIWFDQGTGNTTYWLMNGWTMKSWRGFQASPSYHFAGIGDFNGNGRADLLWTDSSRHAYAWLDNGSGGFTSSLVTTYQSGWSVGGVGDVDGDGKADIFWYNQTTGQLTYWLMNGSVMRSWRGFTVVNSYRPIAVADYNGDGRADLLWTSDARHLWVWATSSTGDFYKQLVTVYSSNYDPFGN
jgi:peptidyl-Asp metalloendopeptidase